MRKRLPAFFGFATILLSTSSILGQAVPTATRSGGIQAGVGITYLNNDYTQDHNGGITAWIDYDFAHLFHTTVGAEAEAHFTGIDSPNDIGENSYFIGPRFVYHFRERTQVFAKILVGRGTISNQDYNTASTYNAYAVGAGVDYHIARHYRIRGEVEQQKWPDFEPRTLSPLSVTIGVLYVIR